ncbi:MAG: LCP family protein [Chloroflexota bacterium]|nr:LCP family protein [Chloroflexota bacterium]
MPSRHRRRSPTLAAALSLVFPGVGQLYVGRPRRAALIALPIVVLLTMGVIAWGVGRSDLVGLLFQYQVVVGLLVVLATLFVYHAWAIVDAYRLALPRAPAGEGAAEGRAEGRAGRPSPTRRRRVATALPLALILALAGALYAAPLYVGARAVVPLAHLFPEQTGSIARPSWESSPTPAAQATPTAAPSPTGTPAGPRGTETAQPTATPGPTATPAPTPFNGPEWARDGRLNIVLLGADEGPGRWSLRTDAVFLLSIEIETGRSAVFGFPRYMSRIPLPPASAAKFPDGRFPGYLNALYVYGLDHRLPDNDERGLGIVAAAVQEIAGVRVDHYVMVNLNGFVQLVDAMGGLWIDVPEPGVSDDRYVPESGRGHLRIRIKPGCQRLDGTMALAFSRSRHQDGDYGRMSRQTVTINAVRRQFDPLAVLPRLPELFDIAGNNVYWTLAPKDVAPIAQVVARVDPDLMQRVLFIPPEYKRALPKSTLEKIRAKVRAIFDEPFEPEATPSGGKEECPPR